MNSKKELEQLVDNLQNLTTLLRSAKSDPLRRMVEPHAEAVRRGEKRLIVHSRQLDVAGERLHFGDKQFIYGVMELGAAKPISIAQFRRLSDQHKISEEERKSWWPRSRRLYAYTVVKLEAFDELKPWKHPVAEQAVATERKQADWSEITTEQQLQVLGNVLSLALTFAKVAPSFVEQAIHLMEPEQLNTALLRTVVVVGSTLVEDYSEVPFTEKPVAASLENIFILAEKLITQLRMAREFLPAETRILVLSEDAIACLEGFLALEDKFVQEGATLHKAILHHVDALYDADGGLIHSDEIQFVEKAEQPKGKLSTLKTPDAAFNIARLRKEQSTGVLSRLQRTGRTGQRQFLLNEVAPTKADAQYVWGVITLDAPVEYADLSKMPDDMRDGIDKFSREEFSTETPIYYMSMKLVAAFNPPLKLKRIVSARRYGPVIELPQALSKSTVRQPQEPTDGSTAGQPREPAQSKQEEKPFLSFRGLTPDILRQLSSEELLQLYATAKTVLETEYTEGRTSVDSMPKEDVENALKFILDECKRRGIDIENAPELAGLYKAGPSQRYAPIHPGSAGELPELKLEELLPHFHEEFLLRSPVVSVVGSIANNGVTKNDIDVLLRGPLDEATAHILKFRLGRMMPAEIGQRMSFHGGALEKDDFAGVGPFTAHLPIYDLVVRRREDYNTIVEMRDAEILVEELEELIAKQDPFLKLPPTEKPFPAVVQHHVRGASVHMDIRIAANGYLIGYTAADAIKGKIAKPETLAEAKKIVSSFAIDGSDWNKPLRAPHRVYAATKAPEPKQWLDVEEGFEPGSVGATRNEKGFMVITARPQVSWGERTPYFHEYFCEKDPKFSGLLTFRLLVSEGGKPTDPDVEAGRKQPEGVPFWTAMFAKSLLPSVLKRRAVNVKRIPPKGWAYLPPGLKSVVPKEFQYWRATEEKERLQIRDALVDVHFFTEENIKLVDSQFKRVVTKYYLYRPQPETALDAIATHHKLDLEQERSFRDYCKSEETENSLLAVERAYDKFAISLRNPPTPPIHKPHPTQTSRILDRIEPVSQEKTAVSSMSLGSAPFTLSWQRWKGAMVIRAAPTRQIYHLFIRRGASVEDFQLLEDPSSNQRVTALHQTASGSAAAELMKLEGEVKPGTSYGGLNLNPTKDTESSISVLHTGTIEFLEDSRAFKKFKLQGKNLPGEFSGLIILRAEEGEGTVWIWEHSEGVGEPIKRSTARCTTGEAGRSHKHSHQAIVDGEGNGHTTETVISDGAAAKAVPHTHAVVNGKVQPAKGHPHDKPTGHVHALSEEASSVNKEEKIATITLAGGEKLTNVQVWDPADIKPGDDKTHDRERLRPLAIYKPMKAAPRPSNEFRSNDMDRLYADFATDEMLKTGIYVQPKWNGFRVSIQRDGEGRLLAISEDIWDRKTPISNFLDHLPGLKKELETIPGPYILDGEFMAVDDSGAPVPRRELATFRGASAANDVNVRVQLFDILYHPTRGNVVVLPLRTRLELLHEFMSKRELERLLLTESRLVHSEEEMEPALKWAREIPGSEGAMLKYAEGTVTLRETDSMAKLKMIREIRGIVWDAHPVKDSPGVFNFFYAVGPVSQEDAKTWVEPVELNGKTYVKMGRSFNSKLNVKTGDTIRIEVTEILWDESNPDKKRLRGFTPSVIDVTDQAPSTLQEVHDLLGSGELKKSSDEVSDAIAKDACGSRHVQIVKTDEERYVLGVVLVPNEYDSQGDIYDEETVRKAAYYFMEQAQHIGLMHRGGPLEAVKIRVLESYVAPVDMLVDAQFVKKGTWLMAARVLDNDLWQAIKQGKLTGWSIEGSALALDIAA